MTGAETITSFVAIPRRQAAKDRANQRSRARPSAAAPRMNPYRVAR
jgi:hypothetical protein